MKATSWLTTAAMVATIGGLASCAQSVPSATQEGASAPAQRSVMSTDIPNGPQLNLDELKAKLPARISAADAEKMLVKIDPDKVVTDVNKDPANYSVQRWGGRGGWGRGFGHGFGRGFGFNRFNRFGLGGFGFGGFGWGGFGGFGGYWPWASSLYYPYGGAFFPYYYNAGFYYPQSYLYNSLYYYPYFYGYGSLYYPYYAYGLGGLW